MMVSSGSHRHAGIDDLLERVLPGPTAHRRSSPAPPRREHHREIGLDMLLHAYSGRRPRPWRDQAVAQAWQLRLGRTRCCKQTARQIAEIRSAGCRRPACRPGDRARFAATKVAPSIGARGLANRQRAPARFQMLGHHLGAQGANIFSALPLRIGQHDQFVRERKGHVVGLGGVDGLMDAQSATAAGSEVASHATAGRRAAGPRPRVRPG